MEKKRDYSKANRVVMIVTWILNGCLCLGYIGEVIKGNQTILRVGILVTLVVVQGIIASVVYEMDHANKHMRYFSFIGFFIVYLFAMFSSERTLIYIYIIPYIISYVMYHEMRMIKIISVSVVVANVLRIIHLVVGLGYISMDLTVDYTIQIVSLIAILVALIAVTQLSMKENEESLKEIEMAASKKQNIMSEVLKIGNLVENSCYRVFENIDNISISSKIVNGAIQNISLAMEETVASVEKQKALTASIQEVIAHTDQLSRKMNEVSEETKEKVEQGNHTMKNLSDNTKLVNEKSDKVYSAMQELERSMLEIQEIIQTINKISSRTSVLSVNATIESARAGEVGVGFGVVADEIRKLSGQTKMAVIKITQIISGLNVNMAMCSASMQNFQSINKQQTALINEVIDIFGKTNEEMDNVKLSANEVSENMGNILLASKAMVDSIDAISGLTEETMASVEETNSTIEKDVSALQDTKELAITLLNRTDEMKKYM